MLLALNTYIDATGNRMKAVALNLIILFFGTICLVVWNVPLGLKLASYMFAGLDGPLSPIFYAWANILTTGDAQVRALTLAVMNSCGAALTTVIQQFLYPVTDAPKFGKGFKASLSFLVGLAVWVVLVRVFEMHAIAQKEAEMERAGSDEGSEQGATTVGVVAESKA
jgi:ACS family pantothenate transporter-like MFS transporter